MLGNFGLGKKGGLVVCVVEEFICLLSSSRNSYAFHAGTTVLKHSGSSEPNTIRGSMWIAYQLERPDAAIGDRAKINRAQKLISPGNPKM